MVAADGVYDGIRRLAAFDRNRERFVAISEITGVTSVLLGEV